MPDSSEIEVKVGGRRVPLDTVEQLQAFQDYISHRIEALKQLKAATASFLASIPVYTLNDDFTLSEGQDHRGTRPNIPPVGKRTIDYILRCLSDMGGQAKINELYERMTEAGWSTTALPEKAPNIVSTTARQYPELVTCEGGLIRINESAALEDKGQGRQIAEGSSTDIVERALRQLDGGPASIGEIIAVTKTLVDYEQVGDEYNIVYKALKRNPHIERLPGARYKIKGQEGQNSPSEPDQEQTVTQN